MFKLFYDAPKTRTYANDSRYKETNVLVMLPSGTTIFRSSAPVDVSMATAYLGLRN